MMTIQSAFVPGERVFVAEGPYTCTVGVFVAPRRDVNWADIQDSGDPIATHPFRWVRRRPEGDLNWSEPLGQA